MRSNLIDPKDPRLDALFKGYVESRRKYHFLAKYEIAEAGITYGSLGKLRFIVVMKSINDYEDDILLDIKEVYEDPDTDNFYNPYRNHGHRMVEASHLYAPGVEQKIGYTSLAGQQYWVRQIPSLQVKIKEFLDDKSAAEFAYCVATQLGLGHQRSLLFSEPGNLVKHLHENYPYYIEIAYTLSEETLKAYKHYRELVCQKMLNLGESIDLWC